MNLTEKLHAAMEKLARWRSVFAGWQLGTRSIDDAECRAVRDHREVTILMRAELNALTKIVLEMREVNSNRWETVLLEEVEQLDKAYEEKFAGMRTTTVGVEWYDFGKVQATMKNWPK